MGHGSVILQFVSVQFRFFQQWRDDGMFMFRRQTALVQWIMPNFKFEFCICTSLFFTWCYVLRNYFQIYWEKLEVELHKLTPKCIDGAWSVMKLKTGSSRPKTARTADACMLSRMPLFVCGAFNVLDQLFALFLPTITTFQLCCRFSDSPRTWIRLLINFTELSFHFFSKFGNNCSERRT